MQSAATTTICFYSMGCVSATCCMQNAICVCHLATEFACQIHLSGTGIAEPCNAAEGSTACQDTDVPPQSMSAHLIPHKPRASSEIPFSTATGATQSSPDLDVLLPEQTQAEGNSAAQVTAAVPPTAKPTVAEVHRPVRYKRKNCTVSHLVQVSGKLASILHQCWHSNPSQGQRHINKLMNC